MDNDFARYACQIPLEGFGKTAQKKLECAKVLVVGVGGLGCPASLYLASSGVGNIGLADDDTVAVKNLHRQILYNESNIGKPKVDSAQKVLKSLNSKLSVTNHDRITFENVRDIIKKYDVVVDCSDNFDTRYLLNDACVIEKKPLVYGAIFQYEGQVAVWNINNQDGSPSPNYRDIFPTIDDRNIPSCTDGGVLPTIGGIIGCIQASEAIKLITGVGRILKSKLLIFDSATMSSYVVNLPDRTRIRIDKLTDNSPGTIDIDKFKKVYNDKSYEIIDVRTKKEHETFSIGGKNIPLDQIIDNGIKLDLHKITIFYCKAGSRSLKAAKLAKIKNPNCELYSLAGGVDLWLENHQG